MSKESILFPGFFIRDDEPAPPATTVRVPLPTKDKEYYIVRDSLSTEVTKDRLVPLIDELLKQIKAKQVVFTEKSVDLNLHSVEIHFKISLSKLRIYSLRKEQLLNILMPLLMDFDSFKGWLKLFGKRVEELWMKCLEDYQLTDSELGEYTPRTQNSYFSSWSRRPNNIVHKVSPLDLLVDNTIYRNYVYVSVYSIPRELAIIQTDAVISALRKSGKSVSPEGMTLFSADDLHSQLDTLSVMVKSGQISYTQKGKVSKSSLKAVNASTDLMPVLKDDKDYLREAIIIATLDLMLKEKVDFKDFYRELVRITGLMNWSIISALCPWLKKVREISALFYIASKIGEIVIHWLKEQKPGTWVDTKELCWHSHTIDLRGLRYGLASLNIEVTKDYFGEADNVIVFVYRVLPRAFLLWLAVFGLLDIAFEDDLCPLEGKVYVKLTPLGEYALKLKDKSPVNTISAKNNFAQINPDTLEITLSPGVNPLRNILDNLMSKTGPDSYRPDIVRFISACPDRAVLREKIQSFTQFVLRGDETIYKSFFDALYARVERTHIVKEDHFVIMELDPTMPELLRLVETDNVIRTFTLKVEGYRLLVPFRKIDHFYSILRKNGFIPESLLHY